MVDCKVGEVLYLSTGPAHFERIDPVVPAQTKVEAPTFACEETAATYQIAVLYMPAGHQSHSGADAVPVAVGADEFESQPMFSVDHIVPEQGGSVVEIGNEEIQIAARVFGEKMVTYDPAEFPPDPKHMAIEMHDFGEAVLKGTAPEVDGYLGMTAVAAIYGVYESGLAGRAVSMDEMLSGQVRAYQQDIDAALGLD